MIDPRFANAGAVPLPTGYGAQPMPFHQHHHRRHHHHRKNKLGNLGVSPISRDESIHKVDHGQHHFPQQEGAAFAGGYVAPYNPTGFGIGGAGGFYQQQPPFVGANYGFGGQFQGDIYNQGQFVGAEGPAVKHHRRHHRHHRHHAAEVPGATVIATGVDQTQGIPEQLIGQRSSSVIGNEASQARSPHLPAEGIVGTDQGGQHRHRRHRHHRHHRSGERVDLGQTHQSRRTRSHTSVGADGYGHINEELIFIERGEQSPHRQDPPAGYEYKGKIEVQGVDREYRSRSRGHGSVGPPAPPPIPGPHPVGPIPSSGPCPPGWQQVMLTAAPGGPCPPSGALYTVQTVGTSGTGQTGFGGIGQAGLGGVGGFGSAATGIGFGGVGPTGAAGTGGGLANLAANLPIPPQGQLIADYFIDSASAGGVGASSGSGLIFDNQQIGINAGGSGGAIAIGGGGSFVEQGEDVVERVSGRPTIIEVWQKRSRSEGHVKSRSRSRSRSRSHSARRSPRPGPSFDFERFRHEILSAIERIAQTGGSGTKIHWTGHDGGTQTQIHPHTGYDDKRDVDRKTTGSGEVRVIVQPIQPVFYMPRQTEQPTITTTTTAIPSVAPIPAIQPAPSGAPQVVYVPRNVYVPVIKPVFVPRERVIVRPQVIHVARPVLVDRPVPVTQRPIIIDRERPIPVPVRGTAQGGASGGGARTVREEYVYRDNLPVAYGGRCADFVGGVNYGYMPAQQDQQYTSSSVHEASNTYLGQTPVINVTQPEQFQHSHSATQLNAQQSGASFHESYANLARTSSASLIGEAPLSCSAPIEILDATVNPTWQRTDKTTLVQRYGRPAYDIVQKTDQVEQQMYQELRQRSSSAGVQRSDSAASYGSGIGFVGSGGGVGDYINNTAVGGGGYMASSTIGGSAGGDYITSGSFSSIPLGDIRNLNSAGIHHEGPGSVPVCVDY